MYLIRDLVSARTWLAFIHHIVGVIIGLAAFFTVVTLMTLSVGAAAADAGRLPGLRAVAAAPGLARPVRAGAIRVPAGHPHRAWPAATRAGYRFWLVPRWQAYAQRATWGEVGYALARFPVSLVFYLLTSFAWALGLVLLTLPLYDGSLPGGGAVIAGHVCAPSRC